ncbi:unnamed protein product [Discosporangium mesarthrocarpum]
MLQVYRIMEKSEMHYLLNKLFIEDYCIWLQKVGFSSPIAILIPPWTQGTCSFLLLAPVAFFAGPLMKQIALTRSS